MWVNMIHVKLPNIMTICLNVMAHSTQELLHTKG